MNYEPSSLLDREGRGSEGLSERSVWSSPSSWNDGYHPEHAPLAGAEGKEARDKLRQWAQHSNNKQVLQLLDSYEGLLGYYERSRSPQYHLDISPNPNRKVQSGHTLIVSDDGSEGFVTFTAKDDDTWVASTTHWAGNCSAWAIRWLEEKLDAKFKVIQSGTGNNGHGSFNLVPLKKAVQDELEKALGPGYDVSKREWEPEQFMLTVHRSKDLLHEKDGFKVYRPYRVDIVPPGSLLWRKEPSEKWTLCWNDNVPTQTVTEHETVKDLVKTIVEVQSQKEAR